MRKILSPNDSRFYTTKLFFKERWPFTRKLTLFIICIIVSFIVTFYASSKGIEQPALNALFILVLATSLWITEAIPPFSVSILLVLAYLSTLLSNVISNTAAASILIPVGTTFLPGAGIIVPIVIGLCASTALLLPISTPPNALAYSTGLLNQGDFRYVGSVMGFLAPPIIIVVVMLLH